MFITLQHKQKNKPDNVALIFCQACLYPVNQKVFTFTQQFAGQQLLLREAFRLLPLKADFDAHRIKFPIAAWRRDVGIGHTQSTTTGPIWPHYPIRRSPGRSGAEPIDGIHGVGEHGTPGLSASLSFPIRRVSSRAERRIVACPFSN